MNRYVFDASALLRFTDKERGWETVEQILTEAASGKTSIFISAVNWGEVAAAIYKRNRDIVQTRRLLSQLRALPMEIVAVDAEMAERAAMFKVDDKLPYVDALAAAVTLKESGVTKDRVTLLTADFDFKNLTRGVIDIEFLPAK